MSKKEIVAAEDKSILREAMRERNMKQTALAEILGMRQASLSGNMNRDRMGLDVFVKILNAMDYDVVVMDRNTGKDLWKVDV